MKRTLSGRAIASKFLSGKDLAKVIVTPSRFEPPGFDATLGRLLLFQEVERHMSQDDKVLLTVVLAHATGIFLKRDVEHPVEAIFDAPVAAHSCAKGSRLPRQAREVIAAFCRLLLAYFAVRFNHANATQPRPGLLGIEIG